MKNGLNKSTPKQSNNSCIEATVPSPIRPNYHADSTTLGSPAVADSLRDLAQQLHQFAEERDWAQFHSPKNLASALVVEAGELLEHFQWLTEEQSRALASDQREAVSAEVADVLLYLVQLASALGIDPVDAARAKLAVNAKKYPVDRARGTSKKYDQL